jgi:hypothetical protein
VEALSRHLGAPASGYSAALPFPMSDTSALTAEAVDAMIQARVDAMIQAGQLRSGGDGNSVKNDGHAADPLMTTDNPLAPGSAALQGGIGGDPDPTNQLTGLPQGLGLHSAAAVICVGLRPDVTSTRRAQYLLSSVVVTVLQSVVTITLYKGVAEPSCLTHLNCPDGYFCNHEASGLVEGVHVGSMGECMGCVHLNDDTREREARFTAYCTGPRHSDEEVCLPKWSNATAFCNLANLTDYSNGVAGCDACYDPVHVATHGDGWNLGKTEGEVVADALAVMRGGDYLALVLVSGLVGIYVAAEWADIKFSEIVVSQRSTEQDPAWLRAVFKAVSGLRQFGFLPLLVATVPQLVAHRGSSSIEICFNGVAVIFLMDLE